MMYTQTFVSGKSISSLTEVLDGSTWFPVTAELLELVLVGYQGSEVLAGLMGRALSSPLIDDAAIEVVARYAVSIGDEDLRQVTCSHPRASLERMYSGSPKAMTPHALQSFVWKHSIAVDTVWSEAQYLALRQLCERARHTDMKGPETMREAAELALAAEL